MTLWEEMFIPLLGVLLLRQLRKTIGPLATSLSLAFTWIDILVGLRTGMGHVKATRFFFIPTHAVLSPTLADETKVCFILNFSFPRLKFIQGIFFAHNVLLLLSLFFLLFFLPLVTNSNPRE
jgi:hypothetical protein